MRKFVEQAHRQTWTGSKLEPASVNDISIYPQTNNWSCGPMALRYCFAWYGADVNQREIAEQAYSTRAGTGVLKLQLAAHRFGFKWHAYTLISARSAKDTIDRLLKRGQPVILCVDNYDHWIAVMHHDHRGYLVFNSDRPGPVIQLRGWKWLKRKMRFVPKETGQPIYFVSSISRSVQREPLGI